MVSRVLLRTVGWKTSGNMRTRGGISESALGIHKRVLVYA